MATKLYHRPYKFSLNESSLNKDTNENKNSSAFENLNANNLSVFYNKDESQFKKKIDKLNLKFYLETDKFISLKSDIEKAQDHLHLLLFKQISEYIDEIERLNLKLQEKNDKEKYPKTKKENFGGKDEDSEKETNHFKKIIWNLEKQLKDSKENESKLKKENDSMKKQISHYKEQLNLEINERKINKERDLNLEINETSLDVDITSKNDNNFLTYNPQTNYRDYNANSESGCKLENIDDIVDTPLANPDCHHNLKVKCVESVITNPVLCKPKKSDASTNFNENNKKYHTVNLNLIGKVKNKRSISYVSQAKTKEQIVGLQRVERKNKSDELTTKTQISLNDPKTNQSKIQKSIDTKKEKVNNYISKTNGKENNSSSKKNPAESNYNTNQFKNEFSYVKKNKIEAVENKFTRKEFSEVAQILLGNMKEEIKLLKEEEDMLNMMRREICEDRNEGVLGEDSYKSCQYDGADIFLSNEISKVKTDDTQNYNSLNSICVEKNKQKTYTNNLMNGIDNKIKNRKKGMKYLSSNKV